MKKVRGAEEVKDCFCKHSLSCAGDICAAQRQCPPAVATLKISIRFVNRSEFSSDFYPPSSPQKTAWEENFWQGSLFLLQNYFLAGDGTTKCTTKKTNSYEPVAELMTKSLVKSTPKWYISH